MFTIDGQLCKVDNEDAYLIEELLWCLNKGKLNNSWYVMRGERIGRRVKKIYLHRLIAGAGKGDRVSFVSSDTLDCRKENLRINGRKIEAVT